MADKEKAAVKKTPVKKAPVKAGAPKKSKAAQQLVGYSVTLVEGIMSLNIKGNAQNYRFVQRKAITVTDDMDQAAFLTEAKLRCTPIYAPKRQKV